MRKINETEKSVHVVSEPGDCTRYDYIAVKPKGTRHYLFKAYGNTFNYPDLINLYDVPEILPDSESIHSEKQEIKETIKDIMHLAEMNNCNFWTVIECMRTIKHLEGEKK